MRTTGTVHPHGRGDNRAVLLTDFVGDGSPPRAWGQCSLAHGHDIRPRFTPTGVGTILYVSANQIVRPVHPHGRGDNIRPGLISPGTTGSPPRAWGQFERKRFAFQQRRFTPTGVGTMTAGWRAAGGRSVHPHGRGDNSLWRGGGQWLDGSPPRAWGQSLPEWCQCRSRRFTPTGVGTIR